MRQPLKSALFVWKDIFLRKKNPLQIVRDQRALEDSNPRPFGP